MGPSSPQGFPANESPTRPTHWNRISPTPRSATAIGFDTSRFPLVVIELPASPTAADHREMFDACNRISAKGQRLAYIVDMRKVNPFALTPAARKEAAAMHAEKIEVRRAVTICEARVIEHPLLRGIAVAFDWLVGHNWPTATFPTFAQAEEWVQAKIRTDKTR